MNLDEKQRDIEAVLCGLGEVEAPVHLGQEVARKLSLDLQASPARTRFNPGARVWQLVSVGATAATIVLSLVTFPSAFRQGNLNLESVHSDVQLAGGTAPLTPPRPIASPQAFRLRVETTPRMRRRRAALAQAGVIYPARAAPATLTEQEKLLIRIAQQGDVAQLASLNDELREAMNARERKEFINFSNGGSQ